MTVVEGPPQHLDNLIPPQHPTVFGILWFRFREIPTDLNMFLEVWGAKEIAVAISIVHGG